MFAMSTCSPLSVMYQHLEGLTLILPLLYIRHSEVIRQVHLLSGAGVTPRFAIYQRTHCGAIASL